MSQVSNVVPLKGRKGSRPSSENGQVPPTRQKNSEVRDREHLTPEEVDRLIASAKSLGRYGHRDATLILMAYRHGLRVSELVTLRWSAVDLKQGVLQVRRQKGGNESAHPLRSSELRALRRLRRDYPDTPYLFVSERKGPLTRSAVRKIVARAGDAAGMQDLHIHPHMLRHSTGYYLANRGIDTRGIQSYLGHRAISSTVRYTALSANRFKDFWQD